VHDLVIVARPELDELVRQGHIAPESRVDVMKSGVGVASARRRAQARPGMARR